MGQVTVNSNYGLIAEMARRRGVPPELAVAVLHQESGGRKSAVSPVGAVGLMQTMPDTLRDPGFGVRPAQNNSPDELARVGVDYLGAMLRRYGGDVPTTLAAYNAGPGRADKYGANVPYAETRKYIKNIMGSLNSGKFADASNYTGTMTDVPPQDDYNPFAAAIAKRQESRQQQPTQAAEDDYNPFAAAIERRKQARQPQTTAQQPSQASGGFNQNPLAKRETLTAADAPKQDALTSFGAGAWRGLQDVGAGLNRVNQTISQINPLSRAANAVTGGAVDDAGNAINEANKRSLADFQQEYGDSGSASFGRMVGNTIPMMVPGTQLPAVTGVVPNVARGAVTGAVQNAIVGGGRNPDSSLASEAALGAGLGAAGSAVGSMLPKIMSGSKAMTSAGDKAAFDRSAIEKMVEFSGGDATRLKAAIEAGNKTLVPGAAPTVSQAAMLPGISQLERTLTSRGAAGGASPMLDRMALQEQARLSAIGNLADTSGMTAMDAAQMAGEQIGKQARAAHQAAKAETRAAYGALRGQLADIPTEPGKGAAILQGVYRQQKPSGDLAEVAKILDDNPTLTFDDLQSLREDLADAAWRAKTGNVAQGSKVQRAANEMKEYVDGLINKHAESAFDTAKQARIQQGKTFERGLAGDITRMTNTGDYKADGAQIMQKLLSPGSRQAQTADDFLAFADQSSRDAAKTAMVADMTEKAVRGTEGAQTILPQSLSGYVDKRSQLLQRILTPEEYKALQAVKQDALRGARATNLDKGIGSNTAQNLFSLGVLDNPIVAAAASKTPLVGGYMQGMLSQARQAGEADMTKEIARLMADPAFTVDAINKLLAAQRMQAIGGRTGGLLSVPASQGLLDR